MSEVRTKSLAIMERTDLSSILNARTKDLNQAKYSYRLDGDGQYGLDAAYTDELEVDEGKMAAWIHYADGHRRDGVGDLLDVGGIVTSRHRKNPIVLCDHGKHVQLPIGVCEDPETGEYVNQIDAVAKTAKLLCFFYRGKGISDVDRDAEYEHALFCEQLFDLWRQKFIRGGSLGYSVIQAEHLAPDYVTGIPQGLHLMQVLMLEASAVVLPANESTVRKALSLPLVCGKPLSPYLVKSLTPYAGEKKVQLGYESREVKTETKSENLEGQPCPPHVTKEKTGCEPKIESTGMGPVGEEIQQEKIQTVVPNKMTEWEADARRKLNAWMKSPERSKIVMFQGEKSAIKEDRKLRAIVHSFLSERLSQLVDKTKGEKPYSDRREVTTYLQSLNHGDYVQSNGRIGVVVQIPMHDSGNSYRRSGKIGTEKAVQWIDTGETEIPNLVNKVEPLLNIHALGLNQKDVIKPNESKSIKVETKSMEEDLPSTAGQVVKIKTHSDGRFYYTTPFGTVRFFNSKKEATSFAKRHQWEVVDESGAKALSTKVETVPVPFTENLNKTKVPPSKWKPGLGAEGCGKVKAMRVKYRQKALDWKVVGEPIDVGAAFKEQSIFVEKDGHKYEIVPIGPDPNSGNRVGSDLKVGVLSVLKVDGNVVSGPGKKDSLLRKAEKEAKKQQSPIVQVLNFKKTSDGNWIASHDDHDWMISKPIPAYRGAPTTYRLAVDGIPVTNSGKSDNLVQAANMLAAKGGVVEVGPKDNKHKIDLDKPSEKYQKTEEVSAESAPKQEESSGGVHGDCGVGQNPGRDDCTKEEKQYKSMRQKYRNKSLPKVGKALITASAARKLNVSPNEFRKAAERAGIKGRSVNDAKLGMMVVWDDDQLEQISNELKGNMVMNGMKSLRMKYKKNLQTKSMVVESDVGKRVVWKGKNGQVHQGTLDRILHGPQQEGLAVVKIKGSGETYVPLELLRHSIAELKSFNGQTKHLEVQFFPDRTQARQFADDLGRRDCTVQRLNQQGDGKWAVYWDTSCGVSDQVEYENTAERQRGVRTFRSGRKSQPKKCSVCEGTGKICRICEESVNKCICNPPNKTQWVNCGVCDGTGIEQENAFDDKNMKSQPSDKVDPKKACQILSDGKANDKPLTESQRGMFGAACGNKDFKSLRQKYRVKSACTPGHNPGRDDCTAEKNINSIRQKSINVRYRNKLIKGFAEVQLKFDTSALPIAELSQFCSEMDAAGFGQPLRGRYSDDGKLQNTLKLATFVYDVEPEGEHDNAVAESIREATAIANKHGARYLGNAGGKSWEGNYEMKSSNLSGKPCPPHVTTAKTGCVSESGVGTQKKENEDQSNEIERDAQNLYDYVFSNIADNDSLPIGRMYSPDLNHEQTKAALSHLIGLGMIQKKIAKNQGEYYVKVPESKRKRVAAQSAKDKTKGDPRSPLAKDPNGLSLHKGDPVTVSGKIGTIRGLSDDGSLVIKIRGEEEVNVDSGKVYLDMSKSRPGTRI